jgi:hypothetical protein
MQDDYPAPNNAAKEGSADTLLALGSNLEQTITKRARVRHPKVRARDHHLIGNTHKAGTDATGPSLNGSLHLGVKELELVIHIENITLMLFLLNLININFVTFDN